MKRQKEVLTLLVALLAAGVVLGGCVGTQTRKNVLIPAMLNTWPGIKADAEKGGANMVMLTKYGVALREKDAVALVAQWPGIKVSVQKHVETLSSGLAASKQERIDNFSAAVKQLAKRPF